MLSIVRHGRTDANRQGLLLGRLDVGLDDLGRRQARALAEHLGPVDRVVSSPLARTRETAAAFDVEVETDERWIELDYGSFDGTPVAEVPTRTWQRWRSDLKFAPPGGESLAALGVRVRDACDSLVGDACGDRHVVVVTHVSPIKAAVAWVLGVGDEVSWRLFVAPASLTTVQIGGADGDGGGVPSISLHAFNRVDHLGHLDD